MTMPTIGKSPWGVFAAIVPTQSIRLVWEVVPPHFFHSFTTELMYNPMKNLMKGVHMPVVKPVSDLQRNLGSVSKLCHETGEAVYLTKNGSASLVVMDAAAFDKKVSIVEDVLRHEERISRAIARGYDDLVNGRVRPWSQARGDVDRMRAERRAG